MLGREKYLLEEKSGGRSWELNLNHNFMKNNDIIFWHQKYSTKYGTKKFFR